MEEEIKNGKVVDLTYVNELSRGNKAFIKEIIKLFLLENPQEMSLLEKGINANDFDQVKTTAHKLKSTLPFIGLDKIVGNEVIEMETLAGNRSHMDQIKAHFERVLKACEQAYKELEPIQATL
jgi:HPt (histidine-containing phosphotransfer) domain-containing protein